MKISIITLSLLLCFSYKQANAQHNFKKVDAWIDANAPQMGGRTILMIYQNGGRNERYKELKKLVEEALE